MYLDSNGGPMIECGLDFCDDCGECLHCYGGDPCELSGGDHNAATFNIEADAARRAWRKANPHQRPTEEGV